MLAEILKSWYDMKKELEMMCMLAAVKGIVRGNTVVIQSEDIHAYEGKEVIVTFLDHAEKFVKKNSSIDWESFRMPSDRGSHVEEYMKEMRDNDRV